MKINHINGYNINYTSNNQQIAPRSQQQIKVNFEKDLNTFNISNDIGKKETETVTIITDSGLEKDIVIETAYWNPQTGMFE